MIPTREDTYGAECRSSNIDDAIIAAVADGARVISISRGGGSNITDGERQAIAGAVARGVVVVVATGNDGAQDPPNLFSSVNGTVGVGASDSAGRIQPYSNYGRGLAVMAPGDLNYHDLGNGGQVASASGTSAATPIVAGFVAVAMQRWLGATGSSRRAPPADQRSLAAPASSCWDAPEEPTRPSRNPG